MSRRKFGVTLLSTPKYYIFSEKEAKNLYYSLIKYINKKYSNSNYDYSIYVGLSNIDGKSIDKVSKSKNKGRPKKVFIPLNEEIKFVNWHFHILICGAPLVTMVEDISDYMQYRLNNKLKKEEFDKSVYDIASFNKYYGRTYNKNIDILLSRIRSQEMIKSKRVPKCSMLNLNVNIRKTKNSKEDYFNIINYIEKQSILLSKIESKGFKIAYFDIAKELNLLAKSNNKLYGKAKKYKG